MFVTAKTRRQSLINSIIMFMLLVTLLGILAWLSNKHTLQYDWTATGRHTLSDASRDLLAQMQEPIEVTSYARQNPALRDSIKKFVDRYQQHKQDIKLHFINPDAVPDEVRNLGIQVDGEIVIRPIMHVALSYDHRLIDGKDAVQFLVSVKQDLEDPSRLLIGL